MDGTSTRKVDDLVAALHVGSDTSKSEVLRIRRELAVAPDSRGRQPGGTVLAELTVKVVYQYADDESLERHTREAEDLMRAALAGHAAMYDLEVAGRRAPIDSFPPA